MTFTFNKATGQYINAKTGKPITADDVFDLADNASASFAEYMLALGLPDRTTGKPFAMRWAAKKYAAKIEQGQRGDKLPRDSAAERAMNRVLAQCFPAADQPKAKPSASKQTDPVAKLLSAYAKLTPAEKRSFLRRI